MKDQNDTRTIMLVLKNIMLSLIPQKTLVLIVVCPHNKGDKNDTKDIDAKQKQRVIQES